MELITQDGAFDATVRRQINDNFSEVAGGGGQVNNTYYVDTVNGYDYQDGRSWGGALKTMAAAFAKIVSNDRIQFKGQVKEQLVAPLGVSNVCIYGLPTLPHHDGASAWLPPASPTATTPLLQLREQGWILANFLMQPHTDDAAVKLSRRESATLPDASHAQFLGMRFAGGFIHIEDDGGSFNVKVDGCTFMLAAGVGGGAIVSTSTTIANPYKWVITNSIFQSNVNHIVMPFNKAVIGYRGKGNVFVQATTAVINLTGGEAPNVVNDNVFNIAAADFDPAGGVTGVTGDAWSNTLTDAIETGLPAN